MDNQQPSKISVQLVQIQSGRHYKTVLGYKWEYVDFEGSTTTETAEM